jgi:hypothetical protein
MYKYAKTIALASFALIWADAAFATGEFTRTCSNIRFDNGLLEANCRTISGAIAQVGYNLNNRIGNEDGRLHWGGRRFTQTSEHCELEGFAAVTVLHCNTQKRDGSWTSSALNLDEHIANLDGNLRYQRGARAQPPRPSPRAGWQGFHDEL